jgi:hypothetical protein
LETIAQTLIKDFDSLTLVDLMLCCLEDFIGFTTYIAFEFFRELSHYLMN